MTFRSLCFIFLLPGVGMFNPGCSADDANTREPAQTSDDGVTGEMDQTPESGQTGSILPSQCLEDDDCLVFVGQTVAELAQPLPAPPTFDRAECLTAGEGAQSGPACACYVAGTSISRRLGPAFLGDCTTRGRLGECLADPAEFPGCQVAVESSECAGLCDALEARLAADAARTFEVAVRSSRCVRQGTGTAISYACKHVFEVEGGCYTTFQPNRIKRYDCSLTDDEILADSAQLP